MRKSKQFLFFALLLFLGQLQANSDYFIIFFVDAPHLNYSNTTRLLKSVAKHPRDWSKHGDVGHAWIYLQGIVDDQPVYLEGGHSGEMGLHQPKYFDGIMDYMEAGDPNPIRYLWEPQCDGFFQEGPGRHKPSFAARRDLTEEQFRKIMRFIGCYPFHEYSLVQKQCCTFVAQIAALAGLHLETEITLSIDSSICFRKTYITLWTDPVYGTLTLASPDKLEKSLQEAVKAGEASPI